MNSSPVHARTRADAEPSGPGSSLTQSSDGSGLAASGLIKAPVETVNSVVCIEEDGAVDVGQVFRSRTFGARPDVLDPALLRPGRFDRHIVVDRPDIKGREAILRVHTRNIKLDKKVNLHSIARQTPGFSGADIANLANEAALLAARCSKEKVGMSELEAAIERVMAGPERKSRVISEYEKNIVAISGWIRNL